MSKEPKLSDLAQDAKPTKDKDFFTVKYANKEMETDKWASNMLKEIGKTLQQGEGQKYVGSMAIHFYTGGIDQLSMKLDFSTIQQLQVADVPQNVTQIGYQNLGIAVAKLFGHKHRTRNTNDKR